MSDTPGRTSAIFISAETYQGASMSAGADCPCWDRDQGKGTEARPQRAGGEKRRSSAP
ncbi:hypothetical protein M413DRAFT_448377 [Hebeloma cylindrosporum]|uniref:Uncharacterized protein n=1 Tax=Hebeloma cylindrosporum TaxID=76867 RepID=A0A0C3BZU5_HEBCY|nr:hypothetical protein M413DRAFT_448377 [Hebeloma cylindrosporum h7]